MKTIVKSYEVNIKYEVSAGVYTFPVTIGENWSPTEYDGDGVGLSAGVAQVTIDKFPRIFKNLPVKKQKEILNSLIPALTDAMKDCDFDYFKPLQFSIREFSDIDLEDAVWSTKEWRKPRKSTPAKVKGEKK